MKRLWLVFALLPILTELPAQSKRQKRAAMEAELKLEQTLLSNLKAHMAFLADDKLEGRLTGTKGEQLAMEYISEQFKSIGLQPKGTDGYIQQFVVEDGKRIEPGTKFVINEKPLQLHNEYFPLAFSANKQVSGMPAMALRERGVPWFLDVKPWVEANKNNPHYDLELAIKDEATRASTKGATALVVYNSGTDPDNLRFNNKDTGTASTIPVVYVTADGVKKYLRDKSALLDMEVNVSFSYRKRAGHNVLGYIDNGAASTIVVGAHYDHLGWGEDGHTMDTGKVVRNGADDNASGTSALIEIARLLSKSKSRANNYLFIAFSGEELGLLGSKYWLDNRTISTPVNYMINMDMVGRYDTERKLTIGGYGTSPAWAEILTAVADNKLQVKYDSTGSGPSDHASFYRKDIPVLFFFTGTHTDYHKASDDLDKINYDGQVQLVKLVNRIVEASQNKGQLAFLKTAEPQVGAVRYSVSLGVIPDYSFSNGGLKIDGVSPKKIASRIGLQAGDILTQLGAYKIFDVQTYMQALSKFKSGDKTSLKIKRGQDEKEFDVEF